MQHRARPLLLCLALASALPAQGDSVAVALVAGDVAACTRGASLTARILDSLDGTILIPGDAAYWSRQHPRPYEMCFDSTWGRHKSRIRPVPGNHDADPDGMRRYFEYFGDAAGPQPGGYYSFTLGAWHVVALNSNIAMDAESAQGRWLAADLAANRSQCTLAVMHYPRFSSGPHGENPNVTAAWGILDSAGVDVVVAGHDHIYERLAPMRADGTLDRASGIRSFVVGVGGNELYGFGRAHPRSEVRQNRLYGLLRLELSPGAYRWEFVSATRSTFRDTGRGRCH